MSILGYILYMQHSLVFLTEIVIKQTFINDNWSLKFIVKNEHNMEKSHSATLTKTAIQYGTCIFTEERWLSQSADEKATIQQQKKEVVLIYLSTLFQYYPTANWLLCSCLRRRKKDSCTTTCNSLEQKKNI